MFLRAKGRPPAHERIDRRRPASHRSAPPGEAHPSHLRPPDPPPPRASLERLPPQSPPSASSVDLRELCDSRTTTPLRRPTPLPPRRLAPPSEAPQLQGLKGAALLPRAPIRSRRCSDGAISPPRVGAEQASSAAAESLCVRAGQPWPRTRAPTVGGGKPRRYTGKRAPRPREGGCRGGLAEAPP